MSVNRTKRDFKEWLELSRQVGDVVEIHKVHWDEETGALSQRARKPGATHHGCTIRRFAPTLAVKRELEERV